MEADKLAELSTKVAELSAKVTELSAKVAMLEAIYQNYLSWAQVIVGVVTLVVALAAVFSFAYIKYVAQSMARAAAVDAAETVAEQVTNDYIQREWPAFLDAYQAWHRAQVEDEEADQISGADLDDGNH